MSNLPAAQNFNDVALTEAQQKKIAAKGAMEHHVSEQKSKLLEQALLIKKQLQDIEFREQIAEKIYAANYNFTPVLLKPYALYEKDDVTTLSLILPDEWSGTNPFGKFLILVRQLGDGTWEPIDA